MTDEEKETARREIKAIAPDMPQEVEAYLGKVNEPQQYDDLKTVLREQTGEPVAYSYNDRGVNIVNGSSRWQHSDNSYLFENGNTGERTSVQYNPQTGEARGVGTRSGEEEMDFYMNAQGRFSARVDDHDGMTMEMSGRTTGSGARINGNVTIRDGDGDIVYSAAGTVKTGESGITVNAVTKDDPGTEDQSVSTLHVNIDKNGNGTVKTSEDGVTTTTTGKMDPTLLAAISSRSR